MTNDSMIRNLVEKARQGDFPRTNVANKVLARIKATDETVQGTWGWGYLTTASAVLAAFTVWTSSTIYQVISDPLAGMMCMYISKAAKRG